MKGVHKMSSNYVGWMSARGIAKFPWLHPKPDTKFNPEGKYKVSLVCDPKDKATKSLVEKIKEYRDDTFGKKASKAKVPYDTDPETGEVIFKMQSIHKPAFFDSSGKGIPENAMVALFGGSELRAGGVLGDYHSGGNVGVSLYMNKVQVINPISTLSNDDQSFDSIDGGFETGSEGQFNDGSEEEEDESTDF
jgi:hypothetical protein